MKTDLLIHPADSYNINYWTKKLGITPRELNDAILNTGSLNISVVKAYLKQSSPLVLFWNSLKTKMHLIH